MARRYLTLSPDEWDALPWWQQRVYLEGYEWEGLIEKNGESQDEGPTKMSGNLGEFSAIGIPEQTI